MFFAQVWKQIHFGLGFFMEIIAAFHTGRDNGFGFFFTVDFSKLVKQWAFAEIGYFAHADIIFKN